MTRPAWRRPPRFRVEVLADTRGERLCRDCGTPLTWYVTHLRPRRRVPFEYTPRIVASSRDVDSGAPVAILEGAREHHCRARRTAGEGRHHAA